jgi:hypothetical protein
MQRKPREPAVAIYGRISIKADEVRRKLESKLGLSASKLIERVFLALAERELNSVQPAE